MCHEGIDVDIAKPNPNAVFRLPSGRELRRSDEVVTFAARNLEPLRGYHVFMRALPHILAKRPRAQVLVIGGDEVSYGAPPAGNDVEVDLLQRSRRPDRPGAGPFYRPPALP